MPFPLIGAIIGGVAAIGGAVAATIGTTGMVVAGLAVATAVVVAIAYLTLDSLKDILKEAKERAKEKGLKVTSSKIQQCLKEGDYYEVNVGLTSRGKVVDEVVVKAEDIDDDEIYEGMKMRI